MINPDFFLFDFWRVDAQPEFAQLLFTYCPNYESELSACLLTPNIVPVNKCVEVVRSDALLGVEETGIEKDEVHAGMLLF